MQGKICTPVVMLDYVERLKLVCWKSTALPKKKKFLDEDTVVPWILNVIRSRRLFEFQNIWKLKTKYGGYVACSTSEAWFENRSISAFENRNVCQQRHLKTEVPLYIENQVSGQIVKGLWSLPDMDLQVHHLCLGIYFPLCAAHTYILLTAFITQIFHVTICFKWRQPFSLFHCMHFLSRI